MAYLRTTLLVTLASFLIKPTVSNPLLLSLAAEAPASSIEVSEKLADTPAYKAFSSSHVSFAQEDLETRAAVPDYLYVLFCTEAGFRGECEVFGAHPGKCVGFSSYKDPVFEATFDNNATSLSTNTGGLCQFYLFPNCDESGNDPGHSMSYAYDLAQNGTDGYVGVFALDGYNNNISSWRC